MDYILEAYKMAAVFALQTIRCMHAAVCSCTCMFRACMWLVGYRSEPMNAISYNRVTRLLYFRYDDSV